VGLSLLVGAADGSVIAGLPRTWYLSLARPPGTPPAWIFAPIWLAVYAISGVAGWLAWRGAISMRPLRLWGWQLAANACWAPAFFALHSPQLALAVSVVVLALTVLTMRAFVRVRPMSAWLMGPYLAWAGYTAYLTAGFWWLNPG
jgi:benzodiazapine receptor